MKETFLEYQNPLAQDYARIFYEEFEKSNNTYNSDTTVSRYGTLKSAFGLIARIGFLLIQVGSIPVQNVYSIMVYNLIEVCTVVLSYGLIGNRIAFGSQTSGGWVGKSPWSWDDVSAMIGNLDNALLGFCGCLLATAQMSSFLVGRISVSGAVVVTAFYSGILQPFLMHWIWHERGWMSRNTLLGYYVSVKDNAGDLALHIPSSIFGATGALFLGRRIMMLRDVDNRSFGSENVTATLIGYLLIIVGYITFALPTGYYEMTHSPYNYSAVVIINNLLAIAGGILAVAILQLIIFRDIFRHRRMIRCVQGAVAGQISIAAAADLYSPSSSLILSVVSSIFFFFFAEVIHSTALEDYCSFISSHFVCGLIGIMLCPLVAQGENLGGTVRRQTLGVHLLWQFICTLVVISLCIIVAVCLFLLVKLCGILRNTFEIENSKRAKMLRDAMRKRSFLERLFVINAATEHIEPGYRNKYPQKTGPSKSVRISDDTPETNKIRKNTSVNRKEARDVEYETMRVEIENTPKTKANLQQIGSGDYYDPYLQTKTSNFAEPTKALSKFSESSWEIYTKI